MRFNKIVLLSGLSLLAASIVVPASVSVNRNLATNGGAQLRADGMPLPPVPPNGTLLVADGMPLPPVPPANGVLVADGMPLPPVPPANNLKELVADGMPLPPVPPHNASVTVQVLA
jgi:hypothetical protein